MDKYYFKKYYVTVHELQQGENYLLDFIKNTPILVALDKFLDIFSVCNDLKQSDKIFTNKEMAIENIFRAMAQWPDKNYTYHLNELESHVFRSMSTESYRQGELR